MQIKEVKEIAEDKIKEIQENFKTNIDLLDHQARTTQDPELVIVYAMLKEILTLAKNNYEDGLETVERFLDLEARINKIESNKGI